MVFFMGLNDELKTNVSPFACFTAFSSVKPTTDRGGWLPKAQEVRFLLNANDLKMVNQYK
jgi:hypothetical protein